ncbi:D-sedoheptulose 7-phosphate isomerase [Halodesulfovibrio aestuarii]|uniref:D-sedoheptulose 7-phosphate isomerase n=1 Tax=Halodesulfovibrio aestuarii TaxID=126333 RepID=UPI003523042C
MTQKAIDTIIEHAREGARLREEYFSKHAEDIDIVARKFAVCLAKGGKIMFCGNGGSAADAQHLAAEFVNRFLIERPPLPSIALTTDSSILTAIGNDYGYDFVFSKQVQALGNENDILVGISTSGNSTNIINALNAARERRLVTVGITGNGGGQMTELCDCLLDVPHSHTPLIQEVQLTIGHLLCQLTDYYLFEDAVALQVELDAGK